MGTQVEGEGWVFMGTEPRKATQDECERFRVCCQVEKEPKGKGVGQLRVF